MTINMSVVSTQARFQFEKLKRSKNLIIADLVLNMSQHDDSAAFYSFIFYKTLLPKMYFKKTAFAPSAGKLIHF